MNSLIKQKAFEIAVNEESMLRQINNTGIFFMPEVAFAYQLGKELAKTKQFKDANLIWRRETKIENYGLADILFENEIDSTSGKETRKSIVIEVKLRGRDTDYLKDIEKLKTLNGKQYRRFFLLLTDVFKDREEDQRVNKIEKEEYTNRIEEFEIFKTKQADIKLPRIA